MQSALSGPTDWILRYIKTYILFNLTGTFCSTLEFDIAPSHRPTLAFIELGLQFPIRCLALTVDVLAVVIERLDVKELASLQLIQLFSPYIS